MLEDFGKAIEDCDCAIKIDPKHTKVSNHLNCLNAGEVLLSESSEPF